MVVFRSSGSGSGSIAVYILIFLSSVINILGATVQAATRQPKQVQARRAAQASPDGAAGGQADPLVVLETLVLDIGVITTYGVSEPTEQDAYNTTTTSSPSQPRLCGSNDVMCVSEYIPTFSTCHSLTRFLTIAGNTTVAGAGRSICLVQSGNVCCVGWSAPAPGLRWANLVPAARDVLQACVEGEDAGVARDVDLAGSCVSQCLSSQASLCDGDGDD